MPPTWCFCNCPSPGPRARLDANIMSRDRFNFSERGSLTGLPQTQVPSDPVVEIADAQNRQQQNVLLKTQASVNLMNLKPTRSIWLHLCPRFPSGQSSTKGAFQGQAFLLVGGGLSPLYPHLPQFYQLEALTVDVRAEIRSVLSFVLQKLEPPVNPVDPRGRLTSQTTAAPP